MKIKYFGHSCFLMETRRGTCILTDPYNGIGYPLPQVRADCVCCTHQHFDHNYVGGVDGVRQTISDAGEYVFEDVKITGIPAFHDEVNGAKRGRNIVYKFEADGVCVCHMGDIGQSPSEHCSERSAVRTFCSFPWAAPIRSTLRGLWSISAKSVRVLLCLCIIKRRIVRSTLLPPTVLYGCAVNRIARNSTVSTVRI